MNPPPSSVFPLWDYLWSPFPRKSKHRASRRKAKKHEARARDKRQKLARKMQRAR